MIEVKTKFLRIRNPTTGEFEVLLSIKGDKGDVLDSIVQNLGDNDDKIISQAFVTSIINELQSSLGSIGSDILNIYTQIETLSNNYESCTATHDELREHCNSQYGDLEAQINDLLNLMSNANDAITALNNYDTDNKTNISINAENIKINANNISTNAENISNNAIDIESAWSMIDKICDNLHMLNLAISKANEIDPNIPYNPSQRIPENPQ